MNITRILMPALLLLGAPAVAAQSPIPRTRAVDSLVIRQAIERGARGFMNANPDSILASYAPDIVLSYPGVPDMGYAELSRGYQELRNRPSNVTAATVPTFDEILVGNDLAVVRVRWTTTISTAPGGNTPVQRRTRYLRDLQIWRKEPTGAWRFMRGMHYPDSTTAPKPGS